MENPVHNLNQLCAIVILILTILLLYFALPFADISLMLMPTITSSDVIALKVINTDNSLLLSAIEYCDWPIDTTAPII